jgi:hypothetical protein
MTRLELTLSVILLISLLFNAGIFVYARNVVVRLLSVADELGDLQKMIDAFSQHISQLYSLEMYYGDQTLKGLLQHANSLNEQLGTFEHIYSLTEEEKEVEETRDETSTDDDTETPS